MVMSTLPARVCRASLALGVLTVSAPAHGAPETARRPRNTVSTNPVRFAILHFQVDYERTIAAKWALFVQPIAFHHATWYPFAHAPGMTANGFGIDLGGRYFVTGAAPEGVFVGPFLSAYRGEVLLDGAMTLEGYVFSPGVQGGYTKLLGRFVLSAGAGLSYGLATEEAPEGSPRAAQLPHHGLWVNFRANVGFAF
jgi:hypothetical protein